MIYPVILEGSISNLAPNVGGALSDARGLQNRTDKILRIDELRFREIRNGVSPQQIDPRAFYTGEAQLRIGNEPISAGLVPIPAMTWPFNYAGEGVVSVADSAFGQYLRFSKPVLLAPGERISAQFRYTTRTDVENVDFFITAMCREAAPGVRGYMPWVTFYKPPVRTNGTGNFVDTSTESDLVNPFDKEMFVERLIGRMDIQPGNGDEEDANTDGVRYAFGATRVRIEDHDAMQVVRDSTPFGVVFDFIRRSWVVNATIRSKGFFKVSIESSLNPAIAGTGTTIQPFVGMLGYREVR